MAGIASILNKGVWLWRRLRVMSAAEIAHRFRWAIGDAIARVRERMQPPGWPVVSRDLLAARFFQAGEPRLFRAQGVRDTGDKQRLLGGEAPVFGRWVTVGTDPRFWHTDPLTGAVWPQLPHRQIDYRPGNPIGDVRTVWELNRLQHLHGLAVIAHDDPANRPVALALLERHLTSWHSANPPGVGVNYLSAMEEALRLVVLLHVADLVRGWWSAEMRALVAGIAAHHAAHIHRNLSLHSSSGNHTIAEATGLLYAGLLLPEWPAARRWRETGRHLLAIEAARQIDADGGGIEQATWYLLFITDLLGLAQCLLAHVGEPAEPAIDAAVARSREFLNALATGPDDLPRIGDSDDGHALSPALRISWQGAAARPSHRCFSVAGLSLASFGDDDRLMFLHNPLGMSPGFGHGHADCLSIVFRWQGTDLLVDPGTGAYGASAEHRRYFRSTGAHNTVTVDGADQALQAGPFLWRHPYRAEVLLSRMEGDRASFLARHDGYAGVGVTHCRGVVYRRDSYLVVWDQLDGAAGHEVALHWHTGCGPVQADPAARRIVLLTDGGREVQMEVLGGSMSTQPGWRSRRYGSVEPWPVIEVKPDGPDTGRIITVLWLGEAGDLASMEPLLEEFARLAAG